MTEATCAAGISQATADASNVRCSAGMTDSKNIRAGAFRLVKSTKTNRTRTARHGDVSNLGQNPVLHAAPEDAAAEEEGIEIPHLAATLDNHESDQTVVTKPIADANRTGLIPSCGEERLQFRFVTPLRREIELVGTERQL